MNEQDLINSINQQLPDNQQRRIKAENTRIVLGNFLAYTKDNYATKEELSEYGSSAIVGIYDDTKLPTDYPLFDANKVNRFIVNTESIGPFISPASWGSITVNFSDIENNEVFFIYESDGSWKKYTKRVKGNPGADGDDGANGTATYNDWQATSYLQDAQVFHEGTIYEVTDPAGAKASDIPGESDKWAIKVMGDLPQSKVLPVPDFIADHDFVFAGGAVAVNSIYYDPLNKVVKGDKIKAVSIYIETNYQNGGTIQIVALDMNENVITTHNVSGLLEGVNTVSWSASFDQDVYIGIKSTDSRLAQDLTLYPGFTYPTRYTLNDGVFWVNGVYPLGTEVHIDDYSETTKGLANKAIYILNTSTTQINAKLKAGGVVNLDSGKEYILDDLKGLKSGTIIHGNFATIKMAPGGSDFLEIIGKEDIDLNNIFFRGTQVQYPNPAPSYGVVGPVASITDVRNKTGKGTERALHMDAVSRIKIDGCRFLNLNGIGFDARNFNSDFKFGIKIVDSYFFNCYQGFDFYEFAEYSTIVNTNINYCQIAVSITSGNMDLTSCRMDGNSVGLYISQNASIPDNNHAHGAIRGGSFNHNSLYGILVDGIYHGFNLADFNCWSAPVHIENSRGVALSDAKIVAPVTVSGMGTGPGFYGKNSIIGCQLESPVSRGTDGIDSHVILRDNYAWRSGSALDFNNTLT